MVRVFGSGIITALVLAWTAFAVITLGAEGNADASKVKNPVPATAASIKTGGALYQKNCSFCHGPTGLGDGKLAPKDAHPANLTDDQWDHGSTDGEIHALILNGVGGTSAMKGVKGRLTDTDVWHIVNYIRSLGPKNAKR
jgi:mono/diheme cytochrome c family protein